MTLQPVRIAHKTREARDICSFELVPADGGVLLPFSAGSHIDVHLDGGLVRPYSLCNHPREVHRYLIAVLREPASRGGSRAMHELQPGQELTVSEPRNHFSVAHPAGRHLLMAGGIGITPILCMAELLAEQGADFELHYCARTAERAVFLSRLRTSAFARRVRLHYDDGLAEQRLDIAAAVAAPCEGSHLYVCGPAGFMDAVLGAARAAGWAEAAMHCEHFAGATAASGRDATFEVQIASSGLVIPVAADQTVAAALVAAGVDLTLSCERGFCGVCLTRVIDGAPDHRDQYLTDTERARGDQFTPCCSRARSPRLVLDL